MINPILSIIIPSFNTADLTINCLKSIFTDKGLKEIPYEIIIIDNASTDDSVSKIKKLSGPITLIENKHNLGFGGANNQGFKIAKGNYILMLNSDTIILHSAISQSLDWLSSHPEAAGCTAQLLNSDESIQASGGYFPNLLNTFTWCLGLDDLPLINQLVKPIHPHTPDFYTHDRYYLHDHPQQWITGAYFLTRKNIIDKVSGFDESYFMYGEELEMMYRIYQEFPTLQLWYLIGPQIIHLGGKSASSQKQIFEREYDGIKAFFAKHHPSQLPLIEKLISINRFLRSTVYTWLKP
jgi:GT2 family glycosyltransferase